MQHSESVIRKPGLLLLALSLASKSQESHLLSLSSVSVCELAIVIPTLSALGSKSAQKTTSFMEMARGSLYCPLNLLV